MPVPAHDPDSDAGTHRASSTSTPPRTPRWVKVSGIILAVLVLVFVAVALFGGGPGGHGPGRHTSSDSPDGPAPLISAAADAAADTAADAAAPGDELGHDALPEGGHR